MRNLLLITFFFSSICFAGNPYFPDCPELDSEFWTDISKSIKLFNSKEIERPSLKRLSRIKSFRHKYIKRDLCNDIQELLSGYPRVKILNEKDGKVLLIDDVHDIFQILLDIPGQYYRIYSIGNRRNGKAFVDKHLNPRSGKLRKDFEELSHFDYSFDSQKVLIDKNFMNNLPSDIESRVTKKICKDKFHNTFKRKKKKKTRSKKF